MINTLDFGRYIYSAIKDDFEDRVYPIVAEEGTKFPFAIYKRVGISDGSTKDGIYEESVTMEIKVVADKYNKSVEYITKVRDKLQKEYVTFDGKTINDATITAGNEEYSGTVYIQNLTMNFRIN